jgi:hypothetical protein
MGCAGATGALTAAGVGAGKGMGLGMSRYTTSPPAMNASKRIPRTKAAPLFLFAAGLDTGTTFPPVALVWLEYFRS